MDNLFACDGHLFKRLAQAGLSWLESNQEKVNQLNVFPVPDGDTGTNMTLTMQKAWEQIAGLEDAHVGRMSRALADGALLGARGNSGVILSQWLRGLAEGLDGKVSFDADDFAAASKRAVDRAYKAVVKPTEGTILTVTRQAMEAVVADQGKERNLQNLFELKVAAAYDSLQHTPDLLPVLKDAGVVDSGAQGWVFIIEGMLRLLRGEDIQIRSASAVAMQRPGWQDALIPEDEEGYGYDVQFLMHGEKLDVDAIRAKISEIGWSTLVVGEERLVKVHVHVHDPGVPISYAISLGATLDDFVVENMQLQYKEYVGQRAAREDERQVAVEGIAVVTAVAGDGFRQMFLQDLGAAYVVMGGQTMNPSTEDFIKAIQSLPNDEIILLPNNPNILLAAQQAASLTTHKKVRVVPSRSIPQGIAAMFEYANLNGDAELDDLTNAMSAVLKNIVTAEVTTAIRDTVFNGIDVKHGQYIGLVDDKLVVAHANLVSITEQLLRLAGGEQRELITLYYGEGVEDHEAEDMLNRMSAIFTNASFQAVKGGQPLYAYIISLE